FLIARIHYNRRDWVKAEEHLSAALREYPKCVEAPESRYLLGRCFWFQASPHSRAAIDAKLPPAEREQARQHTLILLKKALETWAPLENELAKREGDQTLTEDEHFIFRETAFAGAECYFQLEDFPEAVRRYELLRLRYARQIHELIALSQL